MVGSQESYRFYPKWKKAKNEYIFEVSVNFVQIICEISVYDISLAYDA